MSETISRPFTFTKDGVFVSIRRIPEELKHHYPLLGSGILCAPNHQSHCSTGQKKR